MARKYLTQEQTNYIQGRLKILGENTVTLAALLKLPWSTVAGTINGNRANGPARRGIAGFLGEPVEKLFGENSQEHRQDADTDHRQDACAAEDVGAEASHG